MSLKTQIDISIFTDVWVDMDSGLMYKLLQMFSRKENQYQFKNVILKTGFTR